jgi:hypothetical protein
MVNFSQKERPEELMVDNDDALARHVWRGVDNTSKQLTGVHDIIDSLGAYMYNSGPY